MWGSSKYQSRKADLEKKLIEEQGDDIALRHISKRIIGPEVSRGRNTGEHCEVKAEKMTAMAEKGKRQKEEINKKMTGKDNKGKATNLLDRESEVESLLPSGETRAYSPECQTAERRKGREGDPKISKVLLTFDYPYIRAGKRGKSNYCGP